MNLLLNLPLLQTAPANGNFVMIITMVLVLVVMYFLIIRPQRKRQKETENMLKNLKKGDKVTSIGGIKGVIQSVKENTLIVKVDDNTKLEFTKSAISAVDQQTQENAENKAESDTPQESGQNPEKKRFGLFQNKSEK